jgi:hypothetical protein
LAVVAHLAHDFYQKGGRKKMFKKVSKLAGPAVILVALGMMFSPIVTMANPAAIAKRYHTQVVHHPARHAVQFQGQQAAAPDWDYDADGFYTPTRSPGWNDLID